MDSYDFQITPYDTAALLPQVSEALEKRTELVSRNRYPGLWENIDKLNAMSKGKRRNRLRAKIIGIICLVLGIFLLIPGLMEPQELPVPLIAGAFATVIGIVYLYGSRNKKNPFDQSANLLLMGKDTISAKQSIVVSFSETEMGIRADGKDSQHVPYHDFESIIETSDLFLFVHDTRVTVLQKKDLASKTADDFRQFISQKVSRYQAMM